MQRRLAEKMALAAYPDSALVGRYWTEEAACLGDPGWEVFLRADPASVRQAKALCRQCPVRTDCLAKALGMSFNPNGTWGGTTFNERRSIINGSGAADICQTCGKPTGQSRNAIFCAKCRPKRGSWRLPSPTAGTAAGSGG